MFLRMIALQQCMQLAVSSALVNSLVVICVQYVLSTSVGVAFGCGCDFWVWLLGVA